MTGFTKFCHNYIEGYILDIMYFIGISLCALLKLNTVWPLKYKDLAEDDSFWKGQSYDQYEWFLTKLDSDPAAPKSSRL